MLLGHFQLSLFCHKEMCIVGYREAGMCRTLPVFYEEWTPAVEVVLCLRGMYSALSSETEGYFF